MASISKYTVNPLHVPVWEHNGADTTTQALNNETIINNHALLFKCIYKRYFAHLMQTPTVFCLLHCLIAYYETKFYSAFQAHTNSLAGFKSEPSTFFST